jgi:signal transduction histidine kinase
VPDSTHPQMEERIARCRVIFSTLVACAVILDPLQPALNPWVTMLGGSYPMEPDFLGAILLHTVYSVAAYVAVRYRLAAPDRLTRATTAMDVIFAGALAFVTDGKSSLLYPFFTFAIVRTGVQAGFRRTMIVTAASVGLWFALVALWAPAGIAFYVVRPVYLAVVGYLIGYLGEERADLEREVQTLAITQQRLRIARDLHDGYAQVLGALNLQLEGCRQLLQSGRFEETMDELSQLQAGVNDEHDQLRAYLRELAGQPRGESAVADGSDPRFSVRVSIDGSGAVVEEVFRILREGITNVRRHGHATQARIEATTADGRVAIAIDDDGQGFGPEATPPWSIVSRVTEVGGSLQIVRDRSRGAHLAISLPV